MNKTKISKFASNIRFSMTKHSPEILTGIGIAGMITTAILAVKATPKALRIMDEELEYRRIDRENGVDEQFAPDKISKVDAVKLCWKCYIPATVTCVASVACLIGASSVSIKRNAALATAYKLSETALSEYREKVIETIGEKKERSVRDKVNKERIEKNPAGKNEIVIVGNGDTLCYDYESKRYFKSNIDKINKAVNELNRRMVGGLEMYISLNDFYEEIGLESTDIGEVLGWNVSKGMIDVYFSAQIADDGTPCLVLDHNNKPIQGYDKLM